MSSSVSEESVNLRPVRHDRFSVLQAELDTKPEFHCTQHIKLIFKRLGSSQQNLCFDVARKNTQESVGPLDKAYKSRYLLEKSTEEGAGAFNTEKDAVPNFKLSFAKGTKVDMSMELLGDGANSCKSGGF